MKMKEMFPQYFRYLELNNKKQSVYKIKKRLEKVESYFNNKNIEDITKKDILKFKIKLESEYSYSYKKALYYSLNEFYNYLVLFDYIEVNIVKLVGNFKNKEATKKYNYWNYEEFKKFINACDEQVYKSLFNFMFFTGCRLGECLALTFNDIYDQNCININKTITKEFYNGKRLITSPKTKKSNREIYIDENLVNEICNLMQIYKNKYKNYNSNFYIFGGVKPLAPSTIERKKNNYCKKACIQKIKLHEFRHSHATLLLQNNIPIKDVAERLGHSDITLTLNIYTHVSKDKEKRTINVLNSIRSNIN